MAFQKSRFLSRSVRLSGSLLAIQVSLLPTMFHRQSFFSNFWRPKHFRMQRRFGWKSENKSQGKFFFVLIKKALLLQGRKHSSLLTAYRDKLCQQDAKHEIVWKLVQKDCVPAYPKAFPHFFWWPVIILQFYGPLNATVFFDLTELRKLVIHYGFFVRHSGGDNNSDLTMVHHYLNYERILVLPVYLRKPPQDCLVISCFRQGDYHYCLPSHHLTTGFPTSKEYMVTLSVD